MSTESQLNNKRIAKNTMLLYMRMIVTTIVSLYTARLTLQLLGVEDYGIYNVVGGIIGFMGVVTSTMVSATQRFLAFDLGKGDIQQYKRTFSMLINLFAIFSFVAILLLECVGPYIITKYLVIPDERMFAAQCIFQFTLVTFALNTMIIPFTSSIVAYEKMGIYAYFTLLDVFFKLGLVYALYITTIDRLITYGALLTFFSGLITFINYLYCKVKLKGCSYSRIWDRTLFKRMASYAGWNLFGSLSGVLCTYGQSILLNLFFGPIINAAKAIADKINHIISSFVTNFFMAVNPQIIKTYANGEYDYTKKLVLKSSRLAFMLMMVLSFPLILNMKSLLSLWLGENQVNEAMVIFSQLALVFALSTTLENPLTQAMRATGDIKKYQIIIGIQTLSFLPISCVLLYIGAPAYTTMIVLDLICFIAVISRVRLVSPKIQMKASEYTKGVLLPLILSILLSSSFLYPVTMIHIDNLMDLFVRLLLSVIIVLVSCVMVGLDTSERLLLKNKLKNILKNK